MPELTGSVGGRGDNKVHDVCLIQVILKTIKTPKGKPYVTFGYDGTLGLNKGTHNAIKAFQTDYDTLKGTPKETLGKIEKNGATFKKMVAMLPANMKNLATIENLKLVYIEGSPAEAKSSEAAITGHKKFRPAFKQALAKLVRDMYKKYKIVLSVVPDSGGFRTFDDQMALFDKGSHVTGAGPGESNHNFGNGVDIGMDGFTWIQKSGKLKKDPSWLNNLAKANPTAANQLWKLRNALTTLHPSAKSGDLVHLQSFSDSKVSMLNSLVHLLNEVGNMKWDRSGSEYKSNYGLGDTVFNIGDKRSTAQRIWKTSLKCDVSGKNLATALNQAKTRRDKAGGKLPQNQEQIYVDLMSVYDKPPKSPLTSSNIKSAQYNKMRDWLRKDFELAEANYDKWQPVDKSGNVMAAPKTTTPVKTKPLKALSH